MDKNTPSLSILIVEDNPTMRQGMVQILKLENHTVKEEESGEKGWQHCEAVASALLRISAESPPSVAAPPSPSS